MSDLKAADPPGILPADAQLTTNPAAKRASISVPLPKQDLPKLPIPSLEDTCRRYLKSLEGLQDEDEHKRTAAVVKDFLESGEGAKWQDRLVKYNEGVDSYIEEFWCASASEP